jgi:hypothetical protein
VSKVGKVTSSGATSSDTATYWELRNVRVILLHRNLLLLGLHLLDSLGIGLLLLAARVLLSVDVLLPVLSLLVLVLGRLSIGLNFLSGLSIGLNFLSGLSV